VSDGYKRSHYNARHYGRSRAVREPPLPGVPSSSAERHSLIARSDYYEDSFKNIALPGRASQDNGLRRARSHVVDVQPY
jgi:hypothetical protein